MERKPVNIEHPTSIEQTANKIAFGDFQTPVELAAQCCRIVGVEFDAPDVVIEPTCGKGAFVLAAASEFRSSPVIGYEINDLYRREARKVIGSQQERWTTDPKIRKCDFFTADWQRLRARHPGSVLFVGNPPWVTNSQLGALGSRNVPQKSNVDRVRGIDAMTGHSNFDISESMLLTLLAVMRPDQDILAMLVKTATARKVLRSRWRDGGYFRHASIRSIDAKSSFGVSVDACLLLLAPATSRCPGPQVCLASSSLEASPDRIAIGWHAGDLVADPMLAEQTASLMATRKPISCVGNWRSGIKHDVAGVLEFQQVDGQIVRKDGEIVDVESDQLYPLAKGSDVANSRGASLDRRLLITQHAVNESTADLRQTLPATYRYLMNNATAFDARKSSIYRNRDRFALFGIGPYTFAPWKIAICGLYKRLQFTLLGPLDGKGVVVDDTCYFLAFDSRQQVQFVERLLASDVTTQFFRARIFWDAKRPITADLLRRLDLEAVARHLGWGEQYARHFAQDAAVG
ncbi:MAG: SAM-dependent methyltransferase [Pirellulaceae bacterium]|nr:SAM-dependent methyltransferase [Pirellulaceae bacterium]